MTRSLFKINVIDQLTSDSISNTNCFPCFSVYNPDGTFSGWPFQSFHGDGDEDETLSIMANQIRPRIYLDTSTIESMGNIDDADRKLMNFASTIVMEEAFTVNVKMGNGLGRKRVHQRVLFMARFPE
jgi:hypothetical protein